MPAHGHYLGRILSCRERLSRLDFSYIVVTIFHFNRSKQL